MKQQFLILMALIVSSSIYAQSYADKLEVVKLLDGKWEGNLTYLNFQDDKTRGTVELEIVGQRNGDAVSLQYTYYNNGQVVREGKDKVVADYNESKFDFNDSWDVESFEKINDDGFRIVLLTKGKDNGKKAYMKKTINISDSELTIKRDIKYIKGDGDYFNRHVYSLAKK